MSRRAARHPESSRAVSGMLLVDKPVGPSSFAVVRRIRQRVGGKVGHAGTLDPLASGLLLIVVGQATRLARYLVGLDKRYVTEIELGLRTTTGDAEGEQLERPPVPDDLPAALAELTGEIELPVPAASAVKVGGERAYRLHRQGVAVEMPVRGTEVHSIEILRYDPPVAGLELHVGSGTYVRAIADALGGHCRALRRTAVGPFGIEQADEDRVLPPREALPFLPELVLTPEEVGRVLSGRAVERPGEGRARLTFDEKLVAVARLGGGFARPETVVLKAGGAA
jgi:tRNA pseudouridine55 synthase